uniref:Small integral membrane protein 8 n=1 Tax=Zonotrichia albicollis TaxID=44394 RepID=A0A8D2NGA5_ZONAL
VPGAPSPNMPSTKPPNENETPTERKPGLRSVQTTMLFRAVNPELFIKPVRQLFSVMFCEVNMDLAVTGEKKAGLEA